MKTFVLPDLGEGLPEAEIVAWHVAPGDDVTVDQPLVSVETAKAVVEIPAPRAGRIARLHAEPGEVVETGKPLVDFEESDDTAEQAEPARPASEAGQRADAGSVVGSVPTGDGELIEHAVAGTDRRAGRVRAAPAARALARRLGIELDDVEPSGQAGQITAADVRAHAEARKATREAPTEPAGRPGKAGGALRGMRRTMAQAMSASRDQVAMATIFDDADIDGWSDPRPITPRLLRALAAGVRAEPGLNGFFYPEEPAHEVAERVDVALAVDTTEGLIVPVIRDVANKDLAALAREVERVKQSARERTVGPSEMLDYTLSLSNFGTMAGRYATPLIVPPTVAILGAGKLQHDVVAVLGGIEVHRRIPLSLSFDHRCVTGGEAARFLAAVIADLERAA